MRNAFNPIKKRRVLPVAIAALNVKRIYCAQRNK
jgi:hypothetical protein